MQMQHIFYRYELDPGYLQQTSFLVVHPSDRSDHLIIQLEIELETISVGWD
jgi:hypothetical protein